MSCFPTLSSEQRIDNAYVACLPHYTAGQTFFYPAFNARTEDAIKFAHEFGSVLAQPIMLEAVMRVRASKSKSISLRYSEDDVVDCEYQIFGCRRSTEISSSDQRIC